MTDTHLPTQTRQAIEAIDRSAPGKVTGKLKRAIDAMVWEGACRADAAQSAGMTDHSLRTALKKPHVLAYYRGECEVLRTSERSRNIKRAMEIRDAADNMPAIQAIKWLEGEAEQAVNERSRAQAAGVTIVIQSVGQTAGSDRPTIDLPAISIDPEG